MNYEQSEQRWINKNLVSIERKSRAFPYRYDNEHNERPLNSPRCGNKHVLALFDNFSLCIVQDWRSIKSPRVHISCIPHRWKYSGRLGCSSLARVPRISWIYFRGLQDE